MKQFGTGVYRTGPDFYEKLLHAGELCFTMKIHQPLQGGDNHGKTDL